MCIRTPTQERMCIIRHLHLSTHRRRSTSLTSPHTSQTVYVTYVSTHTTDGLRHLRLYTHHRRSMSLTSLHTSQTVYVTYVSTHTTNGLRHLRLYTHRRRSTSLTSLHTSQMVCSSYSIPRDSSVATACAMFC